MFRIFGTEYIVKPGDLVRWMHHGPGQGKICKVKDIIYNNYNQAIKFTLEDDPYTDAQYDITDIRPATYEEINQCVPQVEFAHEKFNPNFTNKPRKLIE